MEHTIDYKTIPKYSTYKKRHIKRFGNTECITEEEFLDITKDRCFYCGVDGLKGIDRVDNDKGYILSNCVPCCKHCNYVKGNLKLEVFNEWKDHFVKYQRKEDIDILGDNNVGTI